MIITVLTESGVVQRARRTETFVPHARTLPCVNRVVENIVQNVQTLNVNYHAVDHVPFVTRQLQKEGLIPIVKAIKSVKGVRCVDLPIGAKLHHFWKTWLP